MTATVDQPPSVVPRSRFRRTVRRLYRFGVGALAGGMLLLLILVFTPVTDGLYRWLTVTERPQQADLIVCLGGRDERLLWTAVAFSRGFAPKVAVSNAPGAAEAMKLVLTHCGIPPGKILVDDRSHTTGEHPAGIAALEGFDRTRDRFLLVTDHEHSRRVAACFRKAGYAHFSIYGGRPPLAEGDNLVGRWKWRFNILSRIAYEYAALAQYWAQGKI